MLKNQRFLFIAGVVVLVAVLGAVWIFNHNEADSAVQSTDDAYLQADLTVVAPQVSGEISSVNVRDYQRVHQGDTLLNIDDRDFKIAEEQARATVANAKAQNESVQAQLVRQESIIRQAHAVLDMDKANLTLAQANQQRYSNLAKDGSGTLQAKQEAESKLSAQQALVARDLALSNEAQQQVGVLNAELHKGQAALAAAEQQLAAAQLHLSYAHLIAPIDGVIAQRSARVGGYVHQGQAVMTIVPLDAIYVEANFRETQLARVQVGQPVSITVDALPGMVFHGTVENLAPASNVSFSPVPAHNATGNFTKIVQRLAVRIHIDLSQPGSESLRVGMSVRAAITVRK
jgi:membrane fusion protein (multidrug efflux system)